MPRSARDQPLGELRKLNQGKLSINSFIEKYQSLVQKSHNVDPELQYEWFIAGLAPGELGYSMDSGQRINRGSCCDRSR